MLHLLAAFQHHGIGFFGQEGPLWFFLGLVFLVVVVAICFKIFKLLLPALGVPEPWVTILYWVFVLLCVIGFYNYAVAHWF
jgi:hypothetical protein